jgi:2-polyprenyl-6-hydroxyphenyl methylase/3-demethylubiquinone-9 3-methyltransferase
MSRMPEPTHGAAEHERFYEGFAHEFDDRMNRYEVGKRLAIIFEDVLGSWDLRGKRLLDAGCGTGLFSQAAARRGAEVTSLDVGPELLAQVAMKCESHRVVGDVAAMPFDDGVFDIVVNTEVIEHTTVPERAVAELVRVTAPGGTLIITTPNRVWHPAVSIANALNVRPYKGLENWVTWGDLRRWLEFRGLEVVEQRGFNALPFIHPVTYPLIDRLDAFGRSRAGRAMINMLVVARKAPTAAT